MNEQASQIKKKLKSLKKETEYAKKLILNEKKLDHLLTVLDRSKDDIVRQSVQVVSDHSASYIENTQRKGYNDVLSSNRSSRPPMISTKSTQNYINLQQNNDLLSCKSSSHKLSARGGHQSSLRNLDINQRLVDKPQ